MASPCGARDLQLIDRIRNTLCSDKSGTVSHDRLEDILRDFHLTPSQIGHYVRQQFPEVTARYGRGRKSTVYTGITLKEQTHSQQQHPAYYNSNYSQPTSHSLFPVSSQPFSPFPVSSQPFSPFPVSSQPFSPFHNQQTVCNQDVVAIINQYKQELAAARALNASLNEQLQAEKALRGTEVKFAVQHEMKRITSQQSPCAKEVRTIEDIRSFNIKQTADFLQKEAPTLYNLICEMTSPQYKREKERSESVAAVVLSAIANHKSRKTTGLQTIVGLMLVARTSNDQVISVVNHAGMSVSPSSTWKVIKQFAAQKREEKLKPDVVFVYDNVNVMRRVRQVRQEKHAVMFNWTSRLAVPLKKTTEELSSVPQGRRQDLTPGDILPGVTEVRSLEKRLVTAVKSFLQRNFKGFSAVPCASTSRRWIPPTNYTPLELLNLDESKTADNIKILTKFAEESGMSTQHNWDQLVVGDQATCKNIRGAKRLRRDDYSVVTRLTWAKENPGDFHFTWEGGKCTVMAHWTSPANVGSLVHLRDLIGRKSMDLKANNFNVMDDFLMNVHDAHLTAALLNHLNMKTMDDSYQGGDTIDEIAQSFVSTVLYKRRHQDRVDDALLQLATSLLFHLLLYKDLREAIRWENGPAIVSHWQLWLPTLLGTKRTQYSGEAANLIANMKADWSEEVAALATNNRTVNQQGREGHGKSTDMHMEHYNRSFKTVVRASGGHLTYEHARDVSLAIPLLEEARKSCDRIFNMKKTVGHTSPSAEQDIKTMTKAIVAGKVYCPTPGRMLFPGNKRFEDPVVKGMAKITEDRWLENFLQKGSSAEEEEGECALEEHEEADLDVLIDE